MEVGRDRFAANGDSLFSENALRSSDSGDRMMTERQITGEREK